jgi:hypothetical protein
MLKLVSLGLETGRNCCNLSRLAGRSIREHGALCRPVSRGGQGVSSVIQLSQHVPANFRFRGSINA